MPPRRARQVHNYGREWGDGTPNLEFLAPSEVYVVVGGGEKHFIDLEVRAAQPASLSIPPLAAPPHLTQQLAHLQPPSPHTRMPPLPSRHARSYLPHSPAAKHT